FTFIEGQYSVAALDLLFGSILCCLKSNCRLFRTTYSFYTNRIPVDRSCSRVKPPLHKTFIVLEKVEDIGSRTISCQAAIRHIYLIRIELRKCLKEIIFCLIGGNCRRILYLNELLGGCSRTRWFWDSCWK